MMKRILVTHIDLDGAGCAILFKQKYPDIEVYYHDYDTIDDIAGELWIHRHEYDEIYFGDISPSEDIGIRMIGDPKFTLIDHHETREYLQSTPWYTPRMCGTTISSLLLCCYPAHQDFINAVDAYDMWELDSPYRRYGEDLNLLFTYYGMEKFVEEFGDMRLPNKTERVILDVLKTMELKYIFKKSQQAKVKVDENDITYWEVYVAENMFGVGSLMDHPDRPAEVQYLKFINPNNGSVGLRSKGDFDVSKIAIANGGGGHVNAAGYTIKEE